MGCEGGEVTQSSPGQGSVACKAKTKLELRQRTGSTYLYTMPAPVVAAFQYQYVLAGRFVREVQCRMRNGEKRKEQRKMDG